MKTLHTKWNTSCSNCDVFIPRGAQVLWIEKGKVECSDCGADTLGRNLTPIVAPIAAPIAAPAAAPSDWMAALAWNPIDGTLPKVDAPKPAPHPIPQALQDNLTAHLNRHAKSNAFIGAAIARDPSIVQPVQVDNVAPLMTPSGNYRLADLKTALNQTGTVTALDAGRANLADREAKRAPRSNVPQLDAQTRTVGDLCVVLINALGTLSTEQHAALAEYAAFMSNTAGTPERARLWTALHNIA